MCSYRRHNSGVREVSGGRQSEGPLLRSLFLFPLTLLLSMAAPAQTPINCETSAPHRTFDFWLGQWTVRTAAGDIAGRNVIRKVQGGCALEEQWTSARGNTGQSINYFDPATREWHQLWTDAGMSLIDIRGPAGENDMQLEGTIVYLGTGGVRGFRGRWTLLEDGRVRQFFEERDEEGSWSPWFEGFYTRED